MVDQPWCGVGTWAQEATPAPNSKILISAHLTGNWPWHLYSNYTTSVIHKVALYQINFPTPSISKQQSEAGLVWTNRQWLLSVSASDEREYWDASLKNVEADGDLSHKWKAASGTEFSCVLNALQVHFCCHRLPGLPRGCGFSGSCSLLAWFPVAISFPIS